MVHVSLRSDQLQNLVQFLFRVPVTERIQVQRRCVFIGNDGHTAHLRAVQEQRKGVVFLLFGGDRGGQGQGIGLRPRGFRSGLPLLLLRLGCTGTACEKKCRGEGQEGKFFRPLVWHKKHRPF